MERRMPRWAELTDLFRFRRPAMSRQTRVRAAATIWDLRRLARRRVPRAVFDYADGAAEAELSLARSREVFDRIEFRPRVLRDVAVVDTSTPILGRESALPLVLAPTGFTRMMHTDGETAGARAAARAGIPYSLSTLGTTSVADLAKRVPEAELWFQLYVWRDRGFASDLLDQARPHGYRTLVLTVDTPVGGARLRDIRNGLSIPPRLRLSTMAEGALHPAWWWDFLTTEALAFASLTDTGGTVAELIDRVFDPSVTFDDVAWLRERWDGPLVVKGIQSAADATAAVDRGADGVIVSNHGGRQLDRAPVTLEVLPEVVEAVGERAEVLVDGGIMTGADLAAVVAFGAKAGMVGRAYLYGLMAGGEAGVARAVEILATEYTRTLKLLGVRSTGELDRTHVKLRP